MKWISKLEKKFGKYAIPNLMNYIIILYIVGFALDIFAPGFYEQYLALNAYYILRGQVWRIFTFIIQPPSTNLIFVIFTMYLYYMIGKTLEYVWGTFRFNLYYFMGVIFHMLAAVLTYVIFHVSLPIGTFYLNLALFLAFVMLNPNQQFLLFGLLPIKAKYLAYIDLAFFVYTIVQAFLPAYGGNPYYGIYYQANALEAFVSLLNFLIFFFASGSMKRFSPKEMKRKQTYQREVKQGQRQMQYGNAGTRHKCAICGRTEQDDENLEFRYCSKCNGNYEYCQDHLFTHEHIK